jgi:DNA (cytosine-5)-methyltransferase 1
MVLTQNKQYFALTERRSEEAKRIRKEYRDNYGKDFSPRRGKEVVPRMDDVANCVTATQGIEQYLLEVNCEFELKGSDKLTNINEVKEVASEGKPFNYVSLFSGIGGFEQALNKLGGTCVMASEIDKYANQAYEILYGHPTVGDVTKVAAEDVPNHDLLVGGFPCQAFSVAGKRLGFEEARGTLFFEIARIAKVKQPKAMLLENVKGLISHDKGKTLDTIIQTLAEIGYTVDFEVLNSKYFGVPQNRERIFIVAVRDDLVKPSPWDIGKRSDVVAKGKRRITHIDGVKTFNFAYPEQNEVTVRLRDILESDVDDRFYLSDEKTSKLVAKIEEKLDGIPIREATRLGYAVAKEGDAINFQFPSSQTRRGRVGKQIAQTLEASNINQGVIEQFSQGDGVSCCIDANYMKGTAPGDVGKGRRTHIVALTERRTDESKRWLKEEKAKGNNPYDSRWLKALAPREDELSNCCKVVTDKNALLLEFENKYRIRKLTPRECFRLQGFPDSEFDKLTANGISNSQLYKMAGNAVTVNVIDAIGKRLITYLND